MITREILIFCELEVKSFPLCIDVPLLFRLSFFGAAYTTFVFYRENILGCLLDPMILSPT
jgi:hypothetical protein